MKQTKLNELMLDKYKQYLMEEEKSQNTIHKYMHDVYDFYCFLPNDKIITKEIMILYKQKLSNLYKINTINSMLISIHSLFDYLNIQKYKVKLYKVQKQTYVNKEDKLTKDEYMRLLEASKQNGNQRLFLLLQTICQTGIRVSEHRFITVESLQAGNIFIHNKGKVREIFVPKKLKKLLLSYCKRNRIKSGSIFITRNKTPLDRSNIWRMMKELCQEAQVSEQKVYPHNLRHLFAFTYYRIEKDIVRLADILGHSHIETTRIYTKTTSYEIKRSIQRIHLALT